MEHDILENSAESVMTLAQSSHSNQITMLRGQLRGVTGCTYESGLKWIPKGATLHMQ